MDLVGKWVVVTHQAGTQMFMTIAGGWTPHFQEAYLHTTLADALEASQQEYDVVPAGKVARYGNPQQKGHGVVA